MLNLGIILAGSILIAGALAFAFATLTALKNTSFWLWQRITLAFLSATMTVFLTITGAALLSTLGAA